MPHYEIESQGQSGEGHSKDNLHGKSKKVKREKFGRAIDFLLACIGFSVGLGNVWRFPYLCYKNGGGAFLIPYFIFVLIGGIPMFYLEVAVGQYMSKGGLMAWNIVPLFQGIGLSSFFIVFFLNCYYNVILAWAFYYMFSSFTTELPWLKCGHPWNTETCKDDDSNTTAEEFKSFSDPVTEFWENKVLHISDGLSESGEIVWQLALCLLLAWSLVYLCICKGLKQSGKVMYVTAPSPYIFMMILLARNITLDGATEGIMFYLKPDLNKLKNPSVWVDAGTQIFFSSSIGLGTLTALGSYNKFHHNSYRDAIIFACVNSGTSFFSGFIVFSILGFMAKQQSKSIADVAESGPGLAFIAYPRAVAQMPLAPFWSVLFFLMIILLGLDSQFIGVEGVVTAVVDQFPHLLHIGYRKEWFILIVCFLMFFIGLSMVTEGGMYVFQLFDFYSGSRIILLIAFFELVAISYVYGVRRFYDNVRMMLGSSRLVKTLPYMVVCWSVLSPLFCFSVFCLSLANHNELTYARPNKELYIYPAWGIAVGWGLAAFSAMWIPVVALYRYIIYGASKESFRMLLVPYYLQPHQRRPQDENEKNLYRHLMARDHESLSAEAERALDVFYDDDISSFTNNWTIGYTTSPKALNRVSPLSSDFLNPEPSSHQQKKLKDPFSVKSLEEAKESK